MSTENKLPIVGVMGSGEDPHTRLSDPLGVMLATMGVHLLTGGGGGVMEAVSRAFAGVTDRRGLVIGIVPSDEAMSANAKQGYPNPYVELAVRTHLLLSGKRGHELGSRNHINVLTSDVIVALPGGPGTRSEIELALGYGKPAIGFGRKPDAALRLDVAGSLDEVKLFVSNHIKKLAGKGQSGPGTD